MITEKFHFTGKFCNGRETSRSKRTVEITGKDLPKFADTLIEQANGAREAGENSRAEYLERVAAHVRKARKLVVDAPLDMKLGGNQ